MSDEKLCLAEAQGKLEASTKAVLEAREKYTFAATITLSETDRRKAHEELVTAKQAEASAKQQIITLQEEAGVPEEVDPVDLLAAVARAVERMKEALGVDKMVYINKIIDEAHSSLAAKELEAIAIRFSAFAELYRKVLTGDDGFSLVAYEGENLARKFIEHKLNKGVLVDNIKLLKEARQTARDENERRQIDKELAGFQEEFDKAVDAEIEAVLKTEVPEIGILFATDRATYIIRKKSGWAQLMEGGVF